MLSLFEGIIVLLSYIKNGKAFPEPLSREDEKYYLEQMYSGNSQARNKLIEHNLRLVAHIVKKYENSRTPKEDLISIGTIGLIKGINTYDSKKKTKLATYVARCIENEILMHLRSIKKLNNETLLQDSIGSDKEGNEITLLDILCENKNQVFEEVEKKLDLEKLHSLLDCLKPREKKVLKLRYGLDKNKQLTQREVASILGISRSYVSRIEKKAVNKLSYYFEKK